MGADMTRLPDLVSFRGGKKGALGGNGVYAFEDVRIALTKENGALRVSLTADETAVSEVTLRWKGMISPDSLLLGDRWERGYGDMEWKKAPDAGVMPWYFLEEREGVCRGYGVKVRPAAMCWWEVKGRDVLLHLDVRCGGEGVWLAGRTLRVAEVLMMRCDGDAFTAARQFCRAMCTDPICRDEPIYGGNNWYYAYGVSSRENILQDSAYLAKMTEGLSNRPFMVIDDGWQSHHTPSYNGGPWEKGNADYGDMARLSADMKACGVRTGIWFRPLLDASKDIPARWRLMRDGSVLDISVPEVLAHVQADVRRICSWGFGLIKHDFSTYDIFGRWGKDMGSEWTEDGWHFADTSRTSAEIIVDFYRAIKEAAGDAIILGCNCIGHLGAGLMEANRTGDDTSGLKWEITRKMGVNTLAFRLAQHGAFFSADADCVGITDKIPWEKNRQWMEILSESGTPFFVSVSPGTLSGEQEEELKAAYRKAAVNTQIAVPLDWKETRTPGRWRTFEGEKAFEW